MRLIAVVGSRKTPDRFLHAIHDFSKGWSEEGWIRTGDADGADTAAVRGAAEGVGRSIVYSPSSHRSMPVHDLAHKVIHLNQVPDLVRDRAFESVGRYHPNQKAMKDLDVCSHARSYLIMSGSQEEESWVEAVVCWTPNGAMTGGTAQVLRIALDHEIPIHNLAAWDSKYWANNFEFGVDRLLNVLDMSPLRLKAPKDVAVC